MKKAVWSILITLVIIVGFCSAFSTSVSADNQNSQGDNNNRGAYSGAVYTMTNDPAGNAVVIFHRDSNGLLTKVGSVSTGGLGSAPAPNSLSAGAPIDPLGSQHSLVLTPDGKWLLAVNAGSNDITVFRVNGDNLYFVDKVNSGGTMPISLAVFSNKVFVLNAGTPNITGFRLTWTGDLNPIAGSTRMLPTADNFGQVGFNNAGNWLVVTDKTASNIPVWSVNYLGIPAGTPKSTASADATPFSFTFDEFGHLLVVAIGGVSGGSVTSYNIKYDGSLKVLSGPIPNGQAAACWIVTNEWGNVFTTNPGSPSISAYKDMVSTGKITLVNNAANAGHPCIDEGLTRDGRFLYGLDPVSGTGVDGGIDMFRVNFNGTLTYLGSVDGGLGLHNAQGLAVR